METISRSAEPLAPLDNTETCAATQEALDALLEGIDFLGPDNELSRTLEWPGRNAFQAWILTGLQKPLERVRNALRVASAYPRSSVARRMLECGQRFEVNIEADGGQHVIRADRCKCRWCADCAQRKTWNVRQNVLKMLIGKDVRMFTLTQRAECGDIGSQFDRMQRGWRKLMKDRLARHMLADSIATTEIKRNEAKGWWHVHKHILVVGHYVENWKLAERWHVALGERAFVDIRKVHDNMTALKYVTKYVGKPLGSLCEIDRALVKEVVFGLAGRRFLSTTGKFTGQRLARVTPVKMISSMWPTGTDFLYAFNNGIPAAVEVAWEIVGNRSANRDIGENVARGDADVD